MSQTWKDSARQSTHRTVLEVTKGEDGTYDIVFNEEVVGSRTPGRMARRGTLCQTGILRRRTCLNQPSTSGVWQGRCDALARKTERRHLPAPTRKNFIHTQVKECCGDGTPPTLKMRIEVRAHRACPLLFALLYACNAALLAAQEKRNQPSQGFTGYPPSVYMRPFQACASDAPCSQISFILTKYRLAAVS